MRVRLVRVAGPFAAIVALSAFQAPLPVDVVATLTKSYLGMSLPVDWAGVEKLVDTKWAPLPPTALKNCLPNGDCFARQGMLAIGGRSHPIVATGARTMVMTLLIRNMAAPFGEQAVLGALDRAGIKTQLARCPVRVGSAGSSWYRMTGSGIASGFLSIQPAATGRPNEGFVVSTGDDLPALLPDQLANYTIECAPGATRAPVSTLKPHQQLAATVVSLLPPSSGPALYDWKALAALPTEIKWIGDAPKAIDLSSKNDPNPMSLNGEVVYAGRKFSVMASGTAAQVKTVYFEEMGLHPKGEHMLGVVYEKGIAVKLVRCGPIYTESTNNWYSLASPKTRPGNIKQSIRYEGNNVQDSYEIRLDGTLPARDPRDRNPGTNGC